MPSIRRTATLPLALVVCVLVVAGVAAMPAVAVGEFLAATGPQDSSAVEASLAPDRSTRRLIQQGLRNEGFDPGTPDGLFGPRTRAAIRDWQQSRGASPTGYLNGAEAQLLRAAAAPSPAVLEAPPPPQAVPAVDPSASSAVAPPASTLAETDSNPAPATVATEEGDPQNAAASNTQQRTRAADGPGNVQLPPEILLDYSVFSDGDDADHPWRSPGFPQTDRHPVTCVSWDDAQTYVSWLSRTTGPAYRLPTWEELAGAAEVSQPGCHSSRPRDVGTCGSIVGSWTRARVRSPPTAPTAWACRTCSGTCPSGRRAAGGVTVAAARFTAAPGSATSTSTSTAPTTSLQAVGPPKPVSAPRGPWSSLMPQLTDDRLFRPRCPREATLERLLHPRQPRTSPWGARASASISSKGPPSPSGSRTKSRGDGGGE